jgi:dTDP-4-amino-4,6-dideoxygalactose transaminase
MPAKIPFARPFMPPTGDLLPYLERIRESRQLTNGGPIHAELEEALCNYLGVQRISLFANGTLALMIALKAMKLKGEIITTPLTSPSTLQAVYWNNLTPVFVDICEADMNMDPEAIKAAITPRTSAILPVHLFGTPCNVNRIDQIAKERNLKVIYDAAHCFGVEINGNSVCNFGDLSILSFHATKVFNTFEGGAVICHEEATKKYIDALKNSGIDRDHKLAGYGINSKMNEIESAMGLCQLRYIDSVIAGRKAATKKYRGLLQGVKGLGMMPEPAGVSLNYSYFPVTVNPEEFGATRDQLADYLEKQNITTRKYFSPLVSDFPEFSMYKTKEMPVAGETARNILCLPLFHDITDEQVETVAGCINRMQREISGKT